MTTFSSPLQFSDPHSRYVGDPVRIERALRQWLWTDEVQKVSLTLLARPKATLGDHDRHAVLTPCEFSKAVRLLVKKLSRKFYPAREVERGKRLHHAFVSECGLQKGLLHYHGWIECPPNVDPYDFCNLVQATWKSLRFGDEANVQTRCDKGWVGYMLKPKLTGEAAHHIDIGNVSLP